MKRRFFLFYILLLTGLCSCKDEYPTEPISDWTQLSKFPGTARASATCFVVGEKAYVCLGRSGPRADFLTDLWEFDSRQTNPDSGWTKKRNFPGAGRVKAVAGVIGKKAYVGMGTIGAYSLSNQFDDFWEYDTETDTWTQKASFPGEARNDLFCEVVNDTLYTTMGFTGIRRSFETWKYDPTTNAWTPLPKSPYEASNVAGFSIGNSFYVGSGFRGCNLDFFYRYNPGNKQWVKRADLPNARMLSNGMTIKNKGYILLGRYWNGALNGGRLLSDIVEYDPVSDTWTKRGDFKGGARQNAVVFSIGDKGYVMMGEDDAERKSDVWMFRP